MSKSPQFPPFAEKFGLSEQECEQFLGDTHRAFVSWITDPKDNASIFEGMLKRIEEKYPISKTKEFVYGIMFMFIVNTCAETTQKTVDSMKEVDKNGRHSNR